MDRWREVFRKGIAPQLTAKELAALARGLKENDQALIQGATTDPLPSYFCQNPAADPYPKGACPLAYGGWKGSNLQTVDEVEDYFLNVSGHCNTLMDDPAAICALLSFWDETPREQARQALLEEVLLALEGAPA